MPTDLPEPCQGGEPSCRNIALAVLGGFVGLALGAVGATVSVAGPGGGGEGDFALLGEWLTAMVWWGVGAAVIGTLAGFAFGVAWDAQDRRRPPS